MISAQSAVKKTQLLFSILEEILSKGKQVIYLDFDLQFSSTLSFKLGKGNFRPGDKLRTIIFGDTAVADMWASFISTQPEQKGGIIVLDSLNSLQELLRGRDSQRSNHEASVLLTLLQQYARDNSLVLFISAIIRSRPTGDPDTGSWGKEISGGRMIRFKSDAIISVEEGSVIASRDRERLQVTVDYGLPRGRTKVDQGEEFSIGLSSIT